MLLYFNDFIEHKKLKECSSLHNYGSLLPIAYVMNNKTQLNQNEPFANFFPMRVSVCRSIPKKEARYDIDRRLNRS